MLPLSRERGVAVMDRMAHVLLVEDYADIRAMLHYWLEGRGHIVGSFATGSGAIEAYQSQAFDIVVTDIGLPDISGILLCAELKAIRNVPVVALTALGHPADRATDLAACFDGIVHKPFHWIRWAKSLQTFSPKFSAPPERRSGTSDLRPRVACVILRVRQ